MGEGGQGPIVADTSALGKILAEEEGAEDVGRAIANREVIIVDFQVSELSNILWKRQYPEDVALLRLSLTLLLVDRVISVLDIWFQAYSIALRHGIPFYDASVIALAKAKNATLLTSDNEQAKIARAEGVPVLFVP